MQTIIIVLDSRKMNNPDLDIRYILPERIEEYTNNLIKDNGYDYLSNTELGLWLGTDDAANNVNQVIQLISTEIFLENDLSETATIFVSEDEFAELDCCRILLLCRKTRPAGCLHGSSSVLTSARR